MNNRHPNMVRCMNYATMSLERTRYIPEGFKIASKDLQIEDGTVFSRWTVKGATQVKVYKNKSRAYYTPCFCNCSSEKIHYVNTYALRYGRSTGCKKCQKVSSTFNHDEKNERLY